jgi:hypothetical protein
MSLRLPVWLHSVLLLRRQEVPVAPKVGVTRCRALRRSSWYPRPAGLGQLANKASGRTHRLGSPGQSRRKVLGNPGGIYP